MVTGVPVMVTSVIIKSKDAIVTFRRRFKLTLISSLPFELTRPHPSHWRLDVQVESSCRDSGPVSGAGGPGS